MPDASPPPLLVRWMRPQTASAVLELPTAPIAASTQKDIAWLAFTAEESEKCEAAWQKLSDEERRLAEGDDDSKDGSRTPEDPDGDVDDDDDDDTVGVSIARDKLFEVDVRTMRLRPIYWKMNASPIKVLRGTWFYDEHRPVPRALSIVLEQMYMLVKPWLPSYQIELGTAFELGPEAHSKLKQPLDDVQSIVFEDSVKAYIVTNTLTKRFFSFFPASASTSQSSTASYYPGSTLLYRGFDAAVAASENTQNKFSEESFSSEQKAGYVDSKDASQSILVSPQQEEQVVKRTDHANKRGRRFDSHGSLPPVGNEGAEDVTDLILIIHGIGQGLTAQYEGFNFVYAANLFRQIARKQSTTPALASIMRDSRAQFLPVQWRTSFKMDSDEAKRREEAGLDNEFTLNDITIKNTVPYVRELMNNVLIDIPYFMSHHREGMIRAVARQANRIYRLWCARNPGFETRGRVHIIAHSLGSSLAGHILSKQPTTQPPLSSMDLNYIKECRDLFLFNTGCIFMLGSPLPLFIHINRTQVIARKGRERTMNSPPDEALDKSGVFGCLAVDSVYNIFNPSDPVAYLQPLCRFEVTTAREKPPSIIKNINTPMFASFSSRVSRLFEGVISSSPKSRSPSRPPISPMSSGGFELGGPAAEIIDGTKEERRFLALNPRGTLDFALPSEGNISGYFDMITAHSAYWADSNLASFILAEIFARKEDLERTGLGVEPSSPRSN